MNVKEKRRYRSKGLDFTNLSFSSAAEQKFVKSNIEKIANTIRDLRLKAGLSQEALAEKVSVSVATVKFIEQNQRAPSLPMLFKIFYYLNKNSIEVRSK
jgi:DNA-binding XRE family transcriptional regulator